MQKNAQKYILAFYGYWFAASVIVKGPLSAAPFPFGRRGAQLTEYGPAQGTGCY